jgi:hypothetical protein
MRAPADTFDTEMTPARTPDAVRHEPVGRGSGNAPPGRRRGRAVVAATWLVLLAVYLASPVASQSDSLPVPYTAVSLLRDGDLDLAEFDARADGNYALVEVDGRVMTYFPWLTAVFAVPVVAVWDVVAATGAVPSVEDLIDRDDLGAFQRVSAALVTATAVVVLALVTRRLLRLAGGRGARSADSGWCIPLCAAVLGLGTSAWSTASRGMWQHGPALLLLGGAWWAALAIGGGRPTRRDLALAATSGALAGAACWTRPTNAVLVTGLGAFLLLRRRDAVLRWTVGAAGAVAAGLVANVVLVGVAVPPYFSAGRTGWHEDLPAALWSDVVGPSRGLLLFSPFLALAVLAVLPRRRALTGADVAAFAGCALGASAAVLVLVAAFAERWWAGHSYGPRFPTETVAVLGPAALVVVLGPRPPKDTARLTTRVVAPVLVAASVLAHAPGALTPAERCWSRHPVDVDRRPDRVLDWTDPQAAAGWAALVRHGPSAGGCDRRSE